MTQACLFTSRASNYVSDSITNTHTVQTEVFCISCFLSMCRTGFLSVVRNINLKTMAEKYDGCYDLHIICFMEIIFAGFDVCIWCNRLWVTNWLIYRLCLWAPWSVRSCLSTQRPWERERHKENVFYVKMKVQLWLMKRAFKGTDSLSKLLELLCGLHSQ